MFIDTCVLIGLVKGDTKIREYLERVKGDLRISRISCVEYLSCPRFSDDEVMEAEQDFSEFEIVELNEDSCKIASDLRRWNLQSKREEDR